MRHLARAAALAFGISSTAAAQATPPPGYGPSFRVKGAFLFPEETRQWMGELGGRLLFFGDASDASGVRARGLFSTDGRTTTFLARLLPARDPHETSIFARLGDVLLFPAREITTLEYVDDYELWRTDGTPEGTWRVKDVNPGAKGSWPEELTPHRGAIYFVGRETTVNASVVTSIYRTDGTDAGTVPVVAPPTVAETAWLASVGDALYFRGRDATGGRELWKLAPCAGAPTLDCPSRVVDLVSPQPPLTPGVDSYPADLTPFGGKLLFTASIPRETAEDPSSALLVSDGTAAGTSVLARLEPWSDSRFRSIVAVGDRAFVVGQTPTTSGYGLWTTDGTPEGTALVFDGFLIWSNALVPMGGDVYFHAGTYAPDVYPAYTDGELWRSDGTRAGTVRVKDLCPGACTSVPSFVPPLADEPDGYLFFTARDPEHGTRLWRSDGTEAGTFLVEDRAAGAEGTPWALARVGDLVYFGLPCPPAEDPSRSSLQLWAVPVDLSDRAAPDLSCPGADVVAEAVSPAGAPVTPPPVAAQDNLSPAPAVVVTPAPGSSFPLGVTRVWATATDDAGNVGACAFDVRVVDTTPPAVRCPADLTAEASSAEGAIVSPPAATATDAVSAVSVVATPAAGSRFLLGRTPVAVTATDAAGNSAACEFAVAVVDTTAPDLACPSDVVVEATSPAGAIATWPRPVAEDAVSGATVATTLGSGTVFPLGATDVGAIAIDASRNAATCNFTVRVVDTTPPALACPADVSPVAPSEAGTAVTWPAPVATDAVTPAPVVTVDRASGDTFLPGVTLVHASATDEAGHTSACEFRVTVSVARPPPSSPPPSSPPPAEQGDGGSHGGCGTPGPGPITLVALALLVGRRRGRAPASDGRR